MYNIGDFVKFTLPGSDGLSHTHDQYKGKVLVLYTYPRDNTPGCSLEAKGFKEIYDEFKTNNTVVLGLNHNSIETHQRFIDKYSLPFPLLIDKDLELVEKLGAKKDEKKVYRKTFIIDEEGKLENIYDKVSVKTHPQEILDYIKQRPH